MTSTRPWTADTLYPVPFQLNDVFYDPAFINVEGHFTDNTMSVHIYTNAARPWWRKNPPLKGSYIARMCEKARDRSRQPLWKNDLHPSD